MQVKEYKANLEKVTEELNQLKKQKLAEKRARNKRLEAFSEKPISDSNQKRNDAPAQIKFAGGGFRMSVDSSVQIPNT